MLLLLVGVLGLASNSLAYNLNPEEEQLVPSGGRMGDSLYGWSLQHFNNKLYVGAPKTSNPTSNAVTECSLTHPSRCNSIGVRGSSGLEEGEWMGGAMAASTNNLYVCAFLQHRKFWAKTGGAGGSKTGAAITGACYKMSNAERQLTQNIDFFKFERTCPASVPRCPQCPRCPGGAKTCAAKQICKDDQKTSCCSNHYQQNLYEKFGHWTFRKEGGHYGFTASISDDSQKLVVGNPMQRTFVWDPVKKKGEAFACGSVGEVNAGNVFKAPGPWHHVREPQMKEKKTGWFALDRPYVIKNHVSSLNNIGKHNTFSLARGKFLRNSDTMSYVMGAPNADTFQGAVYLCTDCFGRDLRVKATMGVDYQSFTGEDHLQMGEGFGWSVAACDLNGDGLDDLVVGSPMYSDPSDEDKHSIGRVHFFLSKSEDQQWGSVDGDSAMLDTPGRLEKGARFGSAVSCLGDTDGDGKQELAVGAPFATQTQGAVFIYEYRNGKMDLTQRILMSEKSFGLRLSPDRLTKTMSVPGLGVGAPEVGKAFYLKIRPTVSFNLQDKVIGILPERIHKEETSFTLEVDPSLRWRAPGWNSQDFQNLNGLQLTANITVTPLGQTRLIEGIGGTQSKTQQVTLSERPGSPKVQFRYENYATRFGDKERLNFGVRIRYELPSCQQSYRENCPLFPDQLDEELDHTAILQQGNRVAVVTLRPQDSQFPINFCESETCQCNIQLEIEKEASIVAGKDDIGQGALLATLRLRNTGTETAYNIEVTILLGVNADLFDLTDTRCTRGICNVKIVEKGTTETLEVRVKSRETLSAQMGRITATINTETDCANDPPSAQVLDVKVVQKWAIRPKADKPSEQVVWDYNNEGAGIHPINMLYTISNQGPSIATAPKVYVLMPTHQHWLPTSNAGVDPPTLEGATCTKATLTSELKNTIGADQDTGNDDVSLSCYPGSQATGCQVFQCAIPDEMAAKKRNVATVQMNFNKTAVVADKEGRTVFSVKAIVCADTSDDGAKKIVCNQEGKSTVQFDYYPLSISGVIVDNWELVGGAIIGIIVIIITFLIFWRCNYFQKVRIYDNAMNAEVEEDEIEMEGTEGTDGMEDVELRG